MLNFFSTAFEKMDYSINADIYQAVVESSPANRATLNHRRRKVAEHRLQQHHGLSWGTSETLSCVPDKAMACMGGFLLFLFFQCLLCKWRKQKGCHPTASRYASCCSAAHSRAAKKLHKVYRKSKCKIYSAAFYAKLWCIVLYYLFYGKLLRAKTKCKKKLLSIVDRCNLMHMKVTIFIYCHLPTLRVSAAVLFLWLFMSGDVELNPGPNGGKQYYSQWLR